MHFGVDQLQGHMGRGFTRKVRDGDLPNTRVEGALRNRLGVAHIQQEVRIPRQARVAPDAPPHLRREYMALAVHDGVERLLDVEEDLVLRVPYAEAAPRYWRSERR